jgi:flagellar basal-body rod protein FlgB
VSASIVGILQFAIDGVTQQQNAIANNVSNVSTPGYTAQEVSFESSLAHAVGTPGEQVASVTSAPSLASPATNGNNVRLGDELVAMQSDTLHYQTVTDSLNAQFRLIQGAAGGSYS